MGKLSSQWYPQGSRCGDLQAVIESILRRHCCLPRASGQSQLLFFSILSLANLAGVSNSRVEVAGKYPWLPLLGGGEEEGGLCLPDRARHRDRDQALPRRAERHRQATHRQHQHPVRRQLRHPLCHLPVQGEFYFSRIFWIFGKTTGIGDILVWMSWLQHWLNQNGETLKVSGALWNGIHSIGASR